MRRLGCKLIPPDAHQGVKATLGDRARVRLPPAVDHRPQFDLIFDQGEIGSCLTNGAAGALQGRMVSQGLPSWTPARLPLYRRALERDGVYPADEGTYAETVLQILSEEGFAPERHAPYSGSPDAIRGHTPDAYTQAAGKARLVGFTPLARDRDTIRFELWNGNPILISMLLYASFEDVGRDGLVRMPKDDEEELGGHGMRLVGYNPECVLVANSWGRSWGQSGYAWIPWRMIERAQFTRTLHSFQTVQIVP